MSTSSIIKFGVVNAALFFTMVLLVKPFSLLVRNHFPDNYAWQANQAADAGNLQKAAQILSSQMSSEHYDFTLHRLYAQILMRQQHPAEAVKLLQLSIDRERAVSGRKVFNRGYNSYKSYKMLSKALADAGDHTAAIQASKRAKEKLALRGEGILSQHK